MKTLEEQWREYWQSCYQLKPGKLNAVQEIETRRAFFAGALVAIQSAVERSETMPEDEAAKSFGVLISEAETVCAQRAFQLKGRN